MFGWGRASGSAAVSKRPGLPRITSPELFAPQPTLLALPDAPLDLRGNPIESAVSDYRLDGRGTLYEGHAPGTSLPRLGAPGT